MVDVYTAEWCGVCKKAMRYMDKEGISYNALDIDASEDTMIDYQKLGGLGVPLIVIGEQRVSGFDPDLIQELLAEI